MKVCILGATGNVGRRLLTRALSDGHQVTAVVRNAKLLDVLHSDNLTIKEIDFDIAEDLSDVMTGHDAVINAAGNVGDTQNFTTLVERIIRAADAALGPSSRFWMFAGAALLDVPDTSTMTLDLPGVPKIYGGHFTNYKVVQTTQLDWSVLCPGPMIGSPDGTATEGLIVSANEWPLERPFYTRFLPKAGMSIAFKFAIPRLTIYYEDAAKVVLDNLASNSRYSHCRVGVALPEGQTRRKSFNLVQSDGAGHAKVENYIHR